MRRATSATVAAVPRRNRQPPRLSPIRRGGRAEDVTVTARAMPGALPLLALDLGTHMGWALRSPACVTSGVKDWVQRKGETRGARLYRFQFWLSELLAASELERVVYESVDFMGTNQRLAAHCWAQFEGVLLAWCARRGVGVATVNVRTLKKLTTGKGNAQKPEMLAAVTARGFNATTHDEADAIAVLLWAESVVPCETTT